MMPALVALLALLTSPDPFSREWCLEAAATDAELTACEELHGPLWGTEEEWLREQGCRFEEPGEETEDEDSIYCEEE